MTAFAVSLGVPPPKLMMASAFLDRANSVAAITLSRGTCWLVSKKTPDRAAAGSAFHPLHQIGLLREAVAGDDDGAFERHIVPVPPGNFPTLPEPKWTSSIGNMANWPFNSCLGTNNIS